MDREKVIKAWECCNPFNRKCKECPYEKDCYHDGVSRHMVADAVALLKEQPDIVLCKDCKHHGEKYTHANGYEYVVCWRDGYGIHKLANGFCDCGERKEEGEVE